MQHRFPHRRRFVFDALTAESGRNPYAPGADPWTFTARDPRKQDAVDTALAEIDRATAGRPTGFAGLFQEIATMIADGDWQAQPGAELRGRI